MSPRQNTEMLLHGRAEPRISRYLDAEAGEVARFLADCAMRDRSLKGEVPSLADWRRFTRQSYNHGARDFCLARIGSPLVAVLTSTLLPGIGVPRRHFRIIVHPKERRRGIGTLLLGRVEGQEPRRAVLQCNCRDSWTAGRSFLAGAGFHVARRHLEMELDAVSTSTYEFDLPTPCQIRPHAETAADDAVWLQIDHEGYADDPDAQRPTIKDLEARRGKRGFRLWLLEREGEALGFLHTTAMRRAHIHSVVVTPKNRGQGLGLVLMVHAMRALRGDGATGFTLSVRADNTPAVALYRTLGFESFDVLETWQRTNGN